MARGRKKGETKNRIEIKEDFMSPYYLTQDERQFVIMKEGNTLAQGYYGSLPNALSRITELLMMDKSEGTVTLKEYIERYNQIKTEITNAVSL